MAKNDHVLNQETLQSLLEYDKQTGKFTWKIKRTGFATLGSRAGTVNREGYINIMAKGKMHSAHRLAWLYVYGEWPLLPVDHINGLTGDNRIENLRLVTPSQNSQNQRRAKKGNISGYLGVTKHGNGWRAQICANGKRTYLGTYKTPDHAYAVYLEAKRKLHEACAI